MGLRARSLVPLVAIVALVVATAAMKRAASVLVPLVAAIFLVGVFWPLQHRLRRHMRNGLAATVTLLALLIVTGAFLAGLATCGNLMAEAWPKYQDQLDGMIGQASVVLQAAGLPSLEGLELTGSGQEKGQELLRYATRLLEGLGAALLVVGFFVLVLLDVTPFRKKLDRHLGKRDSRDWPRAFHDGARDFQRYVLVRTFIGLVNGALAWVFCIAVGLDLAFIWGFQTFLLNYVPTVGSVVATALPALFALVQFESWGWAAAVLGGLGFIQIALGMWFDPLVQGRYLALSPTVVLLSVTFWGWVWGVVGALISVPLTIAVIIACKQSEQTRWISHLLADLGEDDEPEPESS